ncbi:hypothetical protein AB0L44_39890 [Nonomuraea wenchangensis]|uniref:hypothetical protein n=1 Tax=Nonomuraea wenchangensis TaxID=568860 RepID=UPI00343264CF
MAKSTGKGLPKVVIAVAALIGTLVVTGQPAQAGEYDRKPEVTCTSERHPEFADQMADFVRLAVNVGTVVRLEGLREPGVAFYDHVTGTECYSTTDTFFETGSLVKASILGALLHRPQDISDAERPLVEKMILESDNDTSLRLWRESLGCGKDDSGNVRPCTLFRQFLEAAGMDHTYPDDEGAFGDTHTTARDQVRLFRLFSSANPVINETRRTYALGLLRRAEPRYGVPSFAPPGTSHALKVGFSKLGGDNKEWRTNVAGHVSGGGQGYDYVTAFLSDRNEEINHIPWPFNGIARINKVAEQVNCGIRELNGDNTCWDFEDEDCFISSPLGQCRTDRPLRSHRSQHWVRVEIGARLGSTVHWKLVDAANGIVVDEGDAVGGPTCACDKTVHGLYGSYILKLSTNAPFVGETGTIYNHTGGPQDPDPDQPPVVSAGPDLTGAEGQTIELSGFANDDQGTPAVEWTVEPGPDVDAGASCVIANPTVARTTVTCDDDGTFTLKLSAYDGVNAAVGDEARLTLTNVAPATETPRAARAARAAVARTPEPWQVFRAGTSVSLSLPFTDPGANDTHTCLTDWDDGTTSSRTATGLTCQDSHRYTRPGMYTIRTEVTDDDTGSGDHEVMVIVYDPDAGFGTQGGWLSSPAGAITDAPSASGKGHFQSNVKYQPHDEGPEPGNGKVSFRVDPSTFDLESTTLEWLVVTPDDKIAVKGTGTVNGKTGYGFVQYSYDADPDRVRLVVWPLSAGAYPQDTLTYDNVRGAGFDLDVARPQEIAHGSVQAHN